MPSNAMVVVPLPWEVAAESDIANRTDASPSKPRQANLSMSMSGEEKRFRVNLDQGATAGVTMLPLSQWQWSKGPWLVLDGASTLACPSALPAAQVGCGGDCSRHAKLPAATGGRASTDASFGSSTSSLSSASFDSCQMPNVEVRNPQHRNAACFTELMESLKGDTTSVKTLYTPAPRTQLIIEEFTFHAVMCGAENASVRIGFFVGGHATADGDLVCVGRTMLSPITFMSSIRRGLLRARQSGSVAQPRIALLLGLCRGAHVWRNFVAMLCSEMVDVIVDAPLWGSVAVSEAALTIPPSARRHPMLRSMVPASSPQPHTNPNPNSNPTVPLFMAATIVVPWRPAALTSQRSSTPTPTPTPAVTTPQRCPPSPSQRSPLQQQVSPTTSRPALPSRRHPTVVIHERMVCSPPALRLVGSVSPPLPLSFGSPAKEQRVSPHLVASSILPSQYPLTKESLAVG